MSSMTEDQTYQGWANYPTWCVNLWLGNEEGLYRDAVAIAACVVKDAPEDENVAEGIWTVEQTERFRTADSLKEYAEELLPDLGASFPADLLGYAFDQVNWHEIADSWLEIAKDQAS